MIKLFWAIRALCYKPLFKRFGLFSYIGKPIFLKGINKISIGKRVRIFPGARIEVTDKNGSITIEDNISIGQNLHATSGGKLLIQSGTIFAENIMITSIDHEYTQIDIPIVVQPHLIKDTIIGRNCFIGFGVVIQAGTILGKQCIVGANSVVRGTFPDYCVLVGAPARIVKRYNHETMKWERTDKKGNFL